MLPENGAPRLCGAETPEIFQVYYLPAPTLDLTLLLIELTGTSIPNTALIGQSVSRSLLNAAVVVVWPTPIVLGNVCFIRTMPP